MSTISITRPHSLGLAAAREAIEKVGQDLAAQYGLAHQWKGDTLKVHRSGLEGQLAVSDNQVQIDLKLGFLLSAFKSNIEQAIDKELATRLA
jgi:hypothetical protein